MQQRLDGCVTCQAQYIVHSAVHGFSASCPIQHQRMNNVSVVLDLQFVVADTMPDSPTERCLVDYVVRLLFSRRHTAEGFLTNKSFV